MRKQDMVKSINHLLDQNESLRKQVTFLYQVVIGEKAAYFGGFHAPVGPLRTHAERLAALEKGMREVDEILCADNEPTEDSA